MWIASPDEPVVVVIAVVDLHATHLPALPSLDRALTGATRWSDAMSGGAGAAAALSLIDGRVPLDHLREPGEVLERAQRADWQVEVLGVAATLRSEPEWVDAGLSHVPVRAARAPLPSLDGLPAGRQWRVLLLDPFSRNEDPLRPRPGEQNPAGRAWLEEVLAPWIVAQRTGPLAARLHVVLTGIPRAPLRDQRARAMPGGGSVPDALHVPLVWAGPNRIPATIDAPTLVHACIAASLGRAASPAPVARRASAWWSDHCGGVYVELPATAHAPAAGAWIDERGIWSPAEGSADALAARRTEFDAASLAYGFDAGSRPRLWCAVRGSEEIDFVDLSLVGDGLDSTLTGWALEEIDHVREATARVHTFSLAAETRGDGAIVELPWPPLPIEIRVGSGLNDSGIAGVEFHAGAATRSVGLGSLRLAPFTRVFWRAASGAWPDSTDTWWPTAPVGVHVIVSTQRETPVAATWED